MFSPLLSVFFFLSVFLSFFLPYFVSLQMQAHLCQHLLSQGCVSVRSSLILVTYLVFMFAEDDCHWEDNDVCVCVYVCVGVGVYV